MAVTTRVGTVLRHLREGKRLTLEEVAQRLGKRVPNVRGYEWKQANPRWSTLRKHLDALGCTVHELADEAEPDLVTVGRHRRQLGDVLAQLEDLQRDLVPGTPRRDPEATDSPPSTWPVTKYIGPVLASLRAGHDVTVAGLAQRLGKRDMTVRSFEMPSSNPRWTTIATYLDALGSTLHDLADEAEPILAIDSPGQLEDVTAAVDLVRSLVKGMDASRGRAARKA